MLSLLIRRELRASLRSPHTLLQPVLFFTLTICLFPLASGADNEALARIAPAALWIALLLAALLASEQLFAEDYADGTLSQDRIHLHELWQLLAAKLAARVPAPLFYADNPKSKRLRNKTNIILRRMGSADLPPDEE